MYKRRIRDTTNKNYKRGLWELHTINKKIVSYFDKPFTNQFDTGSFVSGVLDSWTSYKRFLETKISVRYESLNLYDVF